MKNNSQKKAWQIFSLMTLLFLIPFLLAKLFYAHKDWLPQQTTNHGQLLTPSQSIQQLSLDPALTHHHWILALVDSGDCELFCQKNLYDMRQLQQALGKDQNRLERILLTPNPVDSQFQSLLNISGTGHWQADAAALNRVLGNATWYVIDPLGNIILSYPANANPENILDDLKHLMNISNIG